MSSGGEMFAEVELAPGRLNLFAENRSPGGLSRLEPLGPGTNPGLAPGVGGTGADLLAAVARGEDGSSRSAIDAGGRKRRSTKLAEIDGLLGVTA